MKVRPDEQEHRTVYPALDSMRAIASVAVVVAHASYWSGTYTSGTLGALSARMDFGVALFFVLSGFLLSKPYLRSLASRDPRPAAGRYLWHRAVRILPVYWLAVVAALTLLPENRGSGPEVWLQDLTLTRLYFADLTPGLTQMWSLSTEVAFYLLLPLAMAVLARTVCRRRWRPGLVVAVLVVVTLAGWGWTALVASGSLSDLHSPGQWLPAYLGWFAVGVGLAVAVVDDTDWLRRLAQAPWSAWLVGGAILLVASTPIAGPVLLESPTTPEAVAKNVLYTAAAAFVVLPAVFAPPTSRFQRILALPALRHLGFISYSLFCCHLLVLHGLFAWRDYTLFAAPFLEVLALTLLISLLVSELLYRVVELPSMRLRNLSRRPRTGTTTDATTPTDATASS